MGPIVSTDWLAARLDQPGLCVADVRWYMDPARQGRAEYGKGHIPGAISFHWARLMEKDNTHKFLPFEQTKAELEKAGLTGDKEILVYCGTSREGSLLRFYLKHVAKFPNVRLYEGSWKEYVSMKKLPAERTENKPK